MTSGGKKAPSGRHTLSHQHPQTKPKMEEGFFSYSWFSLWLVGSFGFGTVEKKYCGECGVAYLFTCLMAIRKQGGGGEHASSDLPLRLHLLRSLTPHKSSTVSTSKPLSSISYANDNTNPSCLSFPNAPEGVSVCFAHHPLVELLCTIF